MAKKILKALTNNLGTKLLALILAVLLWLVVYNMDDPNNTATFTASVNVVNVEYLTDQNICYEVLGDTGTVSFTITTKRSYLQRLENSNFTATANMNKMVVDKGGKTAKVPVEITSSMYNSEITYGTKKYLEISLEDLMSKKFQVVGKSKGNVADGCAVGEVKVINPTVVKVSGPKSIVKKIESVEAIIDVSDMSINISDSVVPRLLDEDAREIDTTRLTLNNSTVAISAEILNTKEVTISYQTSGTPARNYRVSGVTLSTEKVEVKGAVGALNSLTNIDIPREALNISGVSENVTTDIDITEYLPDGVELVDQNKRMVKVEIGIDEYQTRTYQVPAKNIRIEDIPTNRTASWKDTVIDVTISGLKGDLDDLTESDIEGSVSINGLSDGEHRVRITIDLDEEYEVARTSGVLKIKQ